MSEKLSEMLEALCAIKGRSFTVAERAESLILMSRAAAALRAVEGDAWQPIDVEPPHNRKKDSLGIEYLIHPPTSGGDRTAFYGRRLGGSACWYRYGAPVRGVTHWRPLPAPPLDAAGSAEGVGNV